MNEISFAHILFATGVPGKPCPLGGELHYIPIQEPLAKKDGLSYDGN